MAFLAPYIAKGADALAEEIGKKIPGTVGGLIKGLFGRWSGKKEAEILRDFVADPQAHRDTFSATLMDKLRSDPTLAAALKALIEEEKPEVFIKQVVNNSERVIGATVEEITSGNLKVEQHMTGSREVIGARIGKLGN